MSSLVTEVTTEAPVVVRSRPFVLTRTHAIFALLAMCAFVLGLSYVFDLQSLRLDEAQSLWQTSRSPLAILSIVAQDVHVPLYHELLRLWRIMAGDSVASARALSRLFFLLSIPMVYVLGSYVYNRKIGLFAALLLTISPFMNWYGNEIRMYTLFTFMAIVNNYFFLRLFREGSRGATIGYAISGLLGVYSHYFFFFQLAAQAAFYLVRRPYFPRGSWRRLLVSWVFLFACFAPWAWYVYASGAAQNSEPVLAVPNAVNLASTFSEFLFGFQDDHLNTFMLSLWPITIIFVVLALRHTRRTLPETEYFAISVLLPIAIAFGVSFLIQPVFVSRYLIFTVPSFFLLLSSILSMYPPKVAVVTRALLVLLMLLGLGVEILNPAVPVKENYQTASDFLAAHAAPQDVVVLSAPFTLYPVEYYYRGTAPLETIPVWDQYAHGAIPAFSPATLPSDVTNVTAGHQYAWLLLSYDQGYQSQVKTYFDTHFAQVGSKHFSPGMDLYVYQIRYDTPLSQAVSLNLK